MPWPNRSIAPHGHNRSSIVDDVVSRSLAVLVDKPPFARVPFAPVAARN
jgi:hypothetical protein